jgi:uncharacterized protein (TIGR03086 family)
MSDVSERYNRLADAFAAKIAAVPEDKWTARSPCPDWTAHDVVCHVVGTQGMIIGLVGLEMGDIPPAEDDPAGAWKAARSVVQHNLDDPARATQEFEGSMGKMTLEEAVDRFLCVDLVVHGWDLARAAGLDDHISPEDVARVRKIAESFGDAMRSPRAFGPEVEAPADADDQTRLLAFLGRNP